MRFLLSVIDTTTGSATQAEIADIDAFNDRLQADGYWVLACGLGAPSTAVVIDSRNGTSVVTDGPFVQSTEYQSGLWIIDVPSREIALRLAADGSLACRRKVEVRPFL
jgi:hypothetical protein